MADLKREYVIPLRKNFLKVPKWRRAKRGISTLNTFIKRHMKCEDIVICAELNQFIWGKGAKNPPGKISVTCLKTKVLDKYKVIVNLNGYDFSKQLDLYKNKTIEKKDDELKNDGEKNEGDVKDIKIEERSKKKIEEKKEVIKDDKQK